MDIRKRSDPIDLQKTIPELCLQPATALPLKKAKMSDIKKQMRYIPEVYQGFYRKQVEMDSDHEEQEPDTEDSEDTEPVDSQTALKMPTKATTEKRASKRSQTNVLVTRTVKKPRTSVIPRETTTTSQINIPATRTAKKPRTSVIPRESTTTLQTRVRISQSVKPFSSCRHSPIYLFIYLVAIELCKQFNLNGAC